MSGKGDTYVSNAGKTVSAGFGECLPDGRKAEQINDKYLGTFLKGGKNESFNDKRKQK